MDGGRVVAMLLLVLIMSETGFQWFSQMTGWDVTLPHHRAQQTRDEAEVDGGHGVEEGDGAASGSRKQVLVTITSHCLPKLVCQLHSLDNTDTLTASERNLMALIGSVSLSGTPSKYSFAAHMGHLMRGVEGQGCHHFYPECPFSNQDVLQIAKRITFK